MRIRNLNRTQQNLNTVFTEYNVKLKRKKTRTQLIIRTVLIVCLLAFFSGVISGLTGLNAEAKAEGVSAQEPVEQFNPVKKKNKVVVIVIVSDQEEVKELLKKLGVDNARQVAE